MSDEIKDTIFRWFHRAQLDYFDQYINLFIAYNAWFKKVTDENTDRAAITALKSRSGIWEQYLTGITMQSLRPHFQDIVRLTNERPLVNLTRNEDPHWNGVVNADDWQSLIEYWYRVRCNLFHGSKSPEDERDDRVVELAYKSLNVFMTEIVFRMQNNFSKEDLSRLFEIDLIKIPASSSSDDPGDKVHEKYWERAQAEKKILEEKFRDAQNLWEVDL